MLGIVLSLATWSGRDEPLADRLTDPNRTLLKYGFSASPQRGPSRPNNTIEALEVSGGDSSRIALALERCTKRLEKAVVKIALKQTIVNPNWIAPDFLAVGVDQESFQPRHTDPLFQVTRWRQSESAPQFSQPDAFEKFISNILMPWQSPRDFRIRINVYLTEPADESVVANVVAEAFGTGTNQSGIQSTAIWKTTWSNQRDDFILQSIEVIAQEQIVSTPPKAQLFVDSTQSILKRCDSASQQLAFGLDQWAQRIANLDIVGNHGVTVGDINGDGLDDIYVCQPHGLPNLLYVQNPDGTVDDQSHLSQTDILDETHGALMVDLDNDGDQDLVISTDETLVLMSNTGKSDFQIEQKLTVGKNGQSVVAADYDQDGDLDLFLCKYHDVNRQPDLLMLPIDLNDTSDGGRNVLLRNDEGWNFKDVTKQVGLPVHQNYYSRSATWIDFDLDGDQDLYVANEFAADQLFENDSGWFNDVSNKLPDSSRGRQQSVSVGDFNHDGRFDVFTATNSPLAAHQTFLGLASDSVDTDQWLQYADNLSAESQLWLSGGTEENFHPYFLRSPIFSTQSSFSSAVVDINNDGQDDLVVTNGELTRYSREDTNHLFYANAFHPASAQSNRAMRIAHAAHDISELCRIGHSFSSNQRNRCFLGLGAEGFANLSSIAGVDFPDDARGVATADWDGDGDTDIIMSCRTSPQLRVFQNQLDGKQNHVQFDLTGTESNRDAIGTRIELFINDDSVAQVKTLQAGSGNLSQSSKRLTFGLGANESIDRINIVWPSGQSQTFSNLTVNTRYAAIEGESKLAERTPTRFQLAIREGAIKPQSGLPESARHNWFHPRQPLPILDLMVEPNKWTPWRPLDEKPSLMMFLSLESTTERWLLEDWDQIPPEKMDRWAVFLDDGTEVADRWNSAKRWVDDRAPSFRVATASKATQEKLELMVGEWFHHQQPLSSPLAFLIDGFGNVCGTYDVSQFGIRQLTDDLNRIQSPALQHRYASAMSGQWINRYRQPKLNRIRTRLRELGFLRDSLRFEQLSNPQRALESVAKAGELDAIGESQRALSYLQQATSIDPKCVLAYLGEAEILRRDANSPKESQWSKSQIQQAAADSFETAIRLDPQNTRAIIGRANLAIDQNQIEEAIQLLLSSIEISPQRFELHAIVGRLYFHQNKKAKAAQYLIQAFENRPTLPFVAGDLGYLYLNSGEPKNAYPLLEYAHHLQPSDKNVLRLLAEADFMLGQFDLATERFARVIELDPTRRRSLNMLAWLLATNPFESKRDAEKAIAIIRPLVKLTGDRSPTTLEIFAACLAEKGDFDQAIEIQERATKLVNEGFDFYSDDQIQGLNDRLELYNRKRAYRTADISRIPIPTTGIQR